VRVQGDEYATDTTRIKIGELQSVMVKVVPFHVRRISHLLSGPQNTAFSGEAPSLALASSAATHGWAARYSQRLLQLVFI
jgi:hypothetical protein